MNNFAPTISASPSGKPGESFKGLVEQSLKDLGSAAKETAKAATEGVSAIGETIEKAGEKPKDNKKRPADRAIKKTDSLLSRTGKWIKENKKEILLVGAGVAVTWLLTSLFSSEKKTSEALGKRKSSTLGKIAKVLGIGGLLFGGAYLASKFDFASAAKDSVKNTVTQAVDKTKQLAQNVKNKATAKYEAPDDGIERTSPKAMVDSISESSRETFHQIATEYNANSTVYSVVGAVGFMKLDFLRKGVFSVVKSGGKLTKKMAFGILKLPGFAFKHPIVSGSLGVFGYLTYLAATTNYDSKFIPKDPENFRKWLIKELPKINKHLAEQGVEPINPKKVTEIAEAVTNPQKFWAEQTELPNKVKQAILRELEAGKMIDDTSKEGALHLSNTAFALDHLDKDEKKAFKEKASELKRLIDSKAEISLFTIRALFAGLPIVFEITKDGRYIDYYFTSGDEVIGDAERLMINPDLEDEAARVAAARNFHVKGENTGAIDDTNIILGAAVDGAREIVDGFFELEVNAQNKGEITKRLKSGWNLVFEGASVYLRGAGEKYMITSGISIVKEICEVLATDKEFSFREIGVILATGVSYRVVFGTVNSLVRLKLPFKSMSVRSVFINTIVPPAQAFRFLKMNIWDAEGRWGKHSLAKAKAAFEATRFRAKSAFSSARKTRYKNLEIMHEIYLNLLKAKKRSRLTQGSFVDIANGFRGKIENKVDEGSFMKQGIKYEDADQMRERYRVAIDAEKQLLGLETRLEKLEKNPSKNADEIKRLKTQIGQLKSSVLTGRPVAVVVDTARTTKIGTTAAAKERATQSPERVIQDTTAAARKAEAKMNADVRQAAAKHPLNSPAYRAEAATAVSNANAEIRAQAQNWRTAIGEIYRTKGKPGIDKLVARIPAFPSSLMRTYGLNSGEAMRYFYKKAASAAKGARRFAKGRKGLLTLATVILLTKSSEESQKERQKAELAPTQITENKDIEIRDITLALRSQKGVEAFSEKYRQYFGNIEMVKHLHRDSMKPAIDQIVALHTQAVVDLQAFLKKPEQNQYIASVLKKNGFKAFPVTRFILVELAGDSVVLRASEQNKLRTSLTSLYLTAQKKVEAEEDRKNGGTTFFNDYRMQAMSEMIFGNKDDLSIAVKQYIPFAGTSDAYQDFRDYLEFGDDQGARSSALSFGLSAGSDMFLAGGVAKGSAKVVGAGIGLLAASEMVAVSNDAYKNYTELMPNLDNVINPNTDIKTEGFNGSLYSGRVPEKAEEMPEYWANVLQTVQKSLGIFSLQCEVEANPDFAIVKLNKPKTISALRLERASKGFKIEGLNFSFPRLETALVVAHMILKLDFDKLDEEKPFSYGSGRIYIHYKGDKSKTGPTSSFLGMSASDLQGPQTVTIADEKTEYGIQLERALSLPLQPQSFLAQAREHVDGKLAEFNQQGVKRHDSRPKFDNIEKEATGPLVASLYDMLDAAYHNWHKDKKWPRVDAGSRPVAGKMRQNSSKTALKAAAAKTGVSETIEEGGAKKVG